MKFSLSTLILGLLPLALARDIIVTYPKDTPEKTVQQAEKSVTDAGGKITHEYNGLFKGFSANNVPDVAIQDLKTQSPDNQPTIEDDQRVSTNGGSR